MKLTDVCDYINNRTSNIGNYISTENMLPNKGGVGKALSAPAGSVIEYRAGDVLISNIRPYFQKIWYADRDGGCSADVLCLRAKENTDSRYLYYLLSQQAFFDYVMSGVKGCKMPRGDKKQIMQWPVNLPPLAEQKRIAAILGALDDKIELNRRINANLEEQAKALFKEWFVDFEPFKDAGFVDSELGPIPVGWRVGDFTEIVAIKGGGTPKTDVAEYWGGIIPFFTPKDVSDSCYVLKTEKYITDCGLDHCSSALYKKGTVFITARGTVGKIVMAGCNMAMNQTNYALLGKEGINQLFVYNLTIKLADRLLKKSNGAVFNAITVRDFESEKIIIPQHDVLLNFGSVVAPIYAMILHHNNQMENLIFLRDTLLPKLMSRGINME